jgi:hypothetical protein
MIVIGQDRPRVDSRRCGIQRIKQIGRECIHAGIRLANPRPVFVTGGCDEIQPLGNLGMGRTMPRMPLELSLSECIVPLGC